MAGAGQVTRGGCAAGRRLNPTRDRDFPRAAAPWPAGSPPSSRPPRPSSTKQAPPPPAPHLTFARSPSTPLTPLLLLRSCRADRPAGGGVPRQVPVGLRPHRAARLLLLLRRRRPPRRPDAEAAAGRPASLPRPPPRREAPQPASASGSCSRFPCPPPLRLRDCGSRCPGSRGGCCCGGRGRG